MLTPETEKCSLHSNRQQLPFFVMSARWCLKPHAVSNSLSTESKETLILNFHGLGPVPAWVGAAERPYWCEEDRFKSILDSISTLPQQVSTVITFDDGNISDATVALPTLVDLGLTACFFVCAGRIGRPGYLDKSAIRDIISAKMEIGNHGWGHLDWRRIDDDTLDVEIDVASKVIAEVVGRAIDKIAIPFGSYDRRVLRRLRAVSVISRSCTRATEAGPKVQVGCCLGRPTMLRGMTAHWLKWPHGP